VQEQRYALQRRTGSEVDDAAAAGGAHVRRAGAAAKENAERVDVHHLAPLGGADLLERPQLEAAEDRCIVDQHVDAAESLHRLDAIRATWSSAETSVSMPSVLAPVAWRSPGRLVVFLRSATTIDAPSC
jgi:hypothetical protein